jgi:hypothetical protein
MLWENAQADGWDITQMQLYISGTVVLEYEAHSTSLTARKKSTPVQETLKGTNLTGTVSSNETITTSAYENTLYVLEPMTPGVALNSYKQGGDKILEVSFDPAMTGAPRFLKFIQYAGAPLGCFYLAYDNKQTMSYGGQNYEIRFDGNATDPPYLMIRTEFTASPGSNSLPGRRIP